MELVDLMSQKVFEQPVGTVLVAVKEHKIPIHRIVLSDTNDKTIAAVFFITHAETAQKVIAYLDAMDAREEKP